MDGFEKQLNAVLKEIGIDTREKTEKVLDDVADFLLVELKKATPKDTGRTQDSWSRSTKYKGVRYINNSAVNSNGVPIVNLLEYSSKGSPFLRRTVERLTPQIIKILKEEI